jgi:hypothetical protein
MKYIPKDKIQIPPDWNGDQAKALWEFLEEIATAIWEIHEDAILKAFDKENAFLEQAARDDEHEPVIHTDFHADFDDDIPF